MLKIFLRKKSMSSSYIFGYVFSEDVLPSSIFWSLFRLRRMQSFFLFFFRSYQRSFGGSFRSTIFFFVFWRIVSSALDVRLLNRSYISAMCFGRMFCRVLYFDLFSGSPNPVFYFVFFLFWTLKMFCSSGFRCLLFSLTEFISFD